jgi:demethylmenaquinone methyltransferase/2-methoxy-6-polyprenyl-1,4-benzoquinol methylase
MEAGGKDFPLKEFYSDIHRTYDLVNRVFTFGRDTAWRRKAARACLEPWPGPRPGNEGPGEIRILDICTGTGDFLLELAGRLEEGGRDAVLTGYDFSSEMLEEARKKLAASRLGKDRVRINFIEGDVAEMPFDEGGFDAAGITFGIRNLVYENSSAARHLEEIRRVLKPGGRLVILESSKPGLALWRLFNNIYLRLILPGLGGFLSGNLKAYRYLSTSSQGYYSIGQMCGIMERYGFTFLAGRPLFMGSVMLLVLEKKRA